MAAAPEEETISDQALYLLGMSQLDPSKKVADARRVQAPKSSCQVFMYIFLGRFHSDRKSTAVRPFGLCWFTRLSSKQKERANTNCRCHCGMDGLGGSQGSRIKDFRGIVAISINTE